VAARGDWATQQLAEFLVAVSSYATEDDALRGAAERAAEALEAEVGVAVAGGEVRASVGFALGVVPGEEILALGSDWQERAVTLPGLGAGRATVAAVEDGGWLLVVRVSAEAFEPHEVNLLRAMARVLSQTLRMLRALADERALRARVERESEERAALVTLLTERQRLLERLGRIQRSISHRAPLQEVLDAITQGAHELLGDQVCGLRLIDHEQPDEFWLASHCGITDDELEQAGRGPVGQGAGGRAIAENRLVIIDDYTRERNAVPVFQAHRMTTAMAAPVHENGRVVGSLVVASYVPGRHYSLLEQEALTSLAQHASLALTDAKTVEAMREAQRAKDMFLAMVSHELKTPLTVIMGTLRTLESHAGTLSPEVAREIVSTAYGRGEELRRLIDRLLRGARAELAGARREATLRDLVVSSLDGFAQLRRLSVDVSGDASLLVDTVAFSDVLGILVENAVAHSAVDAPLWVSARPHGPEVCVAVTNPGTLPEGTDPQSLFMPFHRGSDARSSGVGLGLYIAARLAESMGGSIDVTSSSSRVTFTLRVPRDAAEPAPPPPAPVVALTGCHAAQARGHGGGSVRSSSTSRGPAQYHQRQRPESSRIAYDMSAGSSATTASRGGRPRAMQAIARRTSSAPGCVLRNSLTRSPCTTSGLIGSAHPAPELRHPLVPGVRLPAGRVADRPTVLVAVQRPHERRRVAVPAALHRGHEVHEELPLHLGRQVQQPAHRRGVHRAVRHFLLENRHVAVPFVGHPRIVARGCGQRADDESVDEARTRPGREEVSPRRVRRGHRPRG